MLYKAKHKQCGEWKTGTWEDLENLDNRIWDVTPDVEPEDPKPLCVVEVVTEYEPCGVPEYPVERAIFSHKDLVGLYLGGRAY